MPLQMYGRCKYYVSMRSSFFVNFARSLGVVHMGLSRSSYKVEAKFIRSRSNVCMKLWSSSYEVGAILFGSLFSTNVSMVQTCYVLILLWKWRVDQSIASVMASYSDYKWQRIVCLRQDGYKAQKIAKLLAEENLPATKQGIHKFLKKYEVVLLVDKKVQDERQR